MFIAAWMILKQFEILSLKWGGCINWLTEGSNFGTTIWSGEGDQEMRWKSQWGQFLLEIMIKH